MYELRTPQPALGAARAKLAMSPATSQTAMTETPDMLTPFMQTKWTPTRMRLKG